MKAILNSVLLILLLFFFKSNAQQIVYQDFGQLVKLEGNAGGKRFDGIGVVNGGGITSALASPGQLPIYIVK